MADIRSFMKEKEKRERNREEYKKKIALHKLASFYRVLAVILALAAVGIFFTIKYKRHVYKDYDIIASVERENVSGATDIRLNDTFVTYSKDGAHCTDAKGNVKWNQTFEIQDIKLSVSGNTVAIGDYNGRSIYIADSEKLLGEVTTTMPIRNVAVSDSGDVAAVLADVDITWLNVYDSSGKQKKEGRTHMDDSGYPMALSLSPNGALLCVAYVYVDAGVLKTNVTFYDFSPVGDNVSDFLASNWSYTDLLVPFVGFIDDTTAFAVGDSRLMIYSGGHKPAPLAEHLFDREVRSVFYSDRYIGLVFNADNNENRYQMDVYDTQNATDTPESFYFDVDYTDIFFGRDNLVIYNETECQIFTMDGTEKYHGNFGKTVRLMLPVGNTYKYLLVTDDTIDTIQLK